MDLKNAECLASRQMLAVGQRQYGPEKKFFLNLQYPKNQFADLKHKNLYKRYRYA